MSIRNVRPVYIEVESDARSGIIGTGPKRRDGQLSALVSVRDTGSVLELLDISGIGSRDGKTVTIEVTDKRTGTIIFSETFTQ